MLIYPTLKLSPLQGMAGMGGGIVNRSTMGAGGGFLYTEWDSTSVAALLESLGNASSFDFVIENSSRLLIRRTDYNASYTSATGTVNDTNTTFNLTGVNLTRMGGTSLTFAGVAGGGGGAMGPCGHGGGGGGGCFKFNVTTGDSSLSNITLKIGGRGRAAYQQTARQNEDVPYGLGSNAFDGGNTEVRLSSDSVVAIAQGGHSGTPDSCSALSGGGSNDSAGGGATITGTTGTTYTGGDGNTRSDHVGKGGGGAASPNAGNGGDGSGSGGQDGSWGDGGEGASWTRSSTAAGGNGYTTSALTSDVRGQNYGGGGGSIETDGGFNTHTGFSGHGGSGVIWIVIN